MTVNIIEYINVFPKIFYQIINIQIQMNIQQYLEEMKNIQENLLIFIENESNDDENFTHLNNLFEKIKIHEDQHKLMSLLHLLSKIANNHYRIPNFFSKIERILLVFQEDIKKFYTNSEIFNIFRGNKRILLSLLEQGTMVIDEYVAKKIISYDYMKSKYPHYFSPEIKPFINEKWFPKYNPNSLITDEWVEEIKKELPENFYENRKIGENETQICKIIRNDLIEDFIIYVSQNNYSLESEICPSIYETNSLLIKKQNDSDDKLTLMEYAAFYGSCKIFKHLQMNGVELTIPLWLFAIHGKNTEIIHILVESQIVNNFIFLDGFLRYIERTDVTSYMYCLKESIKCHHNDISNYIQANLLKKEKDNLNDLFIQGLKSYNFAFIQNDMINENYFYYMCRFGYYLIVDNLLKDKDIDINKFVVEQRSNFFSHRSIYILI